MPVKTDIINYFVLCSHLDNNVQRKKENLDAKAFHNLRWSNKEKTLDYCLLHRYGYSIELCLQSQSQFPIPNIPDEP